MAKHVLLPLLLVIAFVGYGTYEVLGLGTPAPEVSFESEPAGAAVFVDGAARGVTPIVLRLRLGSYAVQMVLGGYETWIGTVTVVPGAPAPTVAHARLVALKGMVTVVVDPQVPGVRLFVDGAEIAATRSGRSSLSLSPGKHLIGARAAGYSSAFQEVAVDPNKSATVTLSLRAISITVPTKTCYGPSGWRYPLGAVACPGLGEPRRLGGNLTRWNIRGDLGAALM